MFIILDKIKGEEGVVSHFESKHLKQMQPAGKDHIELHDFLKEKNIHFTQVLGIKDQELRDIFCHFESKCILNLILWCSCFLSLESCPCALSDVKMWAGC